MKNYVLLGFLITSSFQLYSIHIPHEDILLGIHKIYMDRIRRGDQPKEENSKYRLLDILGLDHPSACLEKIKEYNRRTLNNAATRGDVETVKKMLKYPFYTDPDCSLPVKNSCGITMWASKGILSEVDSNCVRILLQAGAFPCPTAFGMRLENALEDGIDEDEKSQKEFKEKKEALRAFLATEDFPQGLSVDKVRKQESFLSNELSGGSNYAIGWVGALVEKKRLLLPTVINELLTSLESSEK